MKAVVDVHYHQNHAHAACVIFESWPDAQAADTYRVSTPGVRPYRPGRFFERELDPLLAVLEVSRKRFSHIVIDGYGTEFGDYVLNISEVVPCVIDCPAGSAIENEPPAIPSASR